MVPEGKRTTEKQVVAEQKIDAFRKALGPFVTAADMTRMPMVFTDAKAAANPIVYANQAFLNLTGYHEHEVLGQSFDFLMERGTDPDMLVEVQSSFDGARGLEPLVPYQRKDGRTLWLLLFITPVRNEGGDIEQHFASFVDITRQKVEEDRLRALFKRS